MLKLHKSSKFKRDLKLATRREKDLNKLYTVILILLNEQPLPGQYKDHALKGYPAAWRECHLEDDWLLCYYIEDGCLHLARTGTHSDIFE